MGLLDGVLGEQPVLSPLHGLQGALCVLGHARQHPLALGSLAPAAVGLVGWAVVVELESIVEAARGVVVAGGDGVDQLLDARAHQAHCVLGGGGAEHRRRVDDLLGGGVEQPQLCGQRERVLQRQALFSVQQQASAKARQRARVPAAVVDGQTERDLPAQIPGGGLHCLLVREAGAVLEQQHLGQLGGWDRRTPETVRIAVGEVLVRHDPLAVLGQQSEERALGQRPDQLGRVKETDLASRRGEHAGMVPGGPDGSGTFSAGF